MDMAKNASPQNMLVYGFPAVRPSGAEIPQNARLTGVWQRMAKKISSDFVKTRLCPVIEYDRQTFGLYIRSTQFQHNRKGDK